MREQYLKRYQVVMRVLGPVFVGSGREIGKKEYVFVNSRQVGIVDIQKLYHEMTKRRKQVAFEEYLLGSYNLGLAMWLRKQNIKVGEIQPLIKYQLDCGDAVDESNSNRLQVLECIKDAYGNPYIPGSTLKGMFRGIMLGADIINHDHKYQDVKQELRKNAQYKASRTNYLKRDITAIEELCYRTLAREGTKPNDGVNDVMQGIVISDSEPLSVEDLVLCQKVELHTNGIETTLPMLRECIKPNTAISFSMTIDTSVCQWTTNDLVEAVKLFIKNYYTHFAAAFTKIGAPKTNYVFCGGGCGFVSKTIVYPLYGKKEGMELTQTIFGKTGVPRNHKHDKDKLYGASPHIMKCTKYQGKTIPMGMCKIESIKAY